MFRGVVGGGWFPVENEGKGEGGGEGGVGWGQAEEPASQCARVCQTYPLAIYPLVSPRCLAGPIGQVISVTRVLLELDITHMNWPQDFSGNIRAA